MSRREAEDGKKNELDGAFLAELEGIVGIDGMVA